MADAALVVSLAREPEGREQQDRRQYRRRNLQGREPVGLVPAPAPPHATAPLQSRRTIHERPFPVTFAYGRGLTISPVTWSKYAGGW